MLDCILQFCIFMLLQLKLLIDKSLWIIDFKNLCFFINFLKKLIATMFCGVTINIFSCLYYVCVDL